MLRALLSTGGFTALSRVTGFIRDIIMARVMGAGLVSDAFVVAFRLPNHFRAIFAEGAFNAAFVPQYVRRKTQDGLTAALNYAENILAWQIAAQVLLLGVALLAMPAFVAVLAPGFASKPDQLALATELTRITFPYLICMAVSTQLSGLLNAANRFWAAAAAPILLNIAMAGALLLWIYFPTKGHAAAVGVLIGGVFELGFLILIVWREGLGLNLVRPRWDENFKSFLKALGPATVGSAGVQIGLFADTMIASFLQSGQLTALYYADRVNQLPLGIVGVALGTVLLPHMSAALAKNDRAGADAYFNRGLNMAAFLVLPCTALFLAIPREIILALFARGAFDMTAAEASASALAAYAIGLPAFVLIRCVTPLFHARGDTARPVRATIISIVANIAVKIALIGPLGATGLALGTAIGAWVNLAVLVFLAYRGTLLEILPTTRTTAAVVALASSALFATVLIGSPYASQATAELATFKQESALLLLGVVGAIVYFGTLIGGGFRFSDLRR